MALNLRAEPWTLVFGAVHRGIKPIPYRLSKRTQRRIKDGSMKLFLD